MKRFIKSSYFLVGMLVLMVLLEYLPPIFHVYVRDASRRLKLPWIITFQLLQVFLLVLCLFGLVCRYGKKVVIINAVAIVLILYSFDFVLWKSDPYLKLPFDSPHYFRNFEKYHNLQRPADASNINYSWGHKLRWNRLRFRERDFQEPKPVEIFRIMVVGDSFTFGTGLAESERYSNLLEKLLREKFPSVPPVIEVLNFGIRGVNTISEYILLRKYIDKVQPDLLIFGFCYNDVRLRGEKTYRAYELYKRNFRWYKRILMKKMSFIGLSYLGGMLEKLTDKIGDYIYNIPADIDLLKRAYDPREKDWAIFSQSLRDIKRLSDKLKLPPPIFAILNHFPGYHCLSDLDQPSEECKFLAQCFAQVGQEAKTAGFNVVTFEDEVFARLRRKQLKFTDLPINVIDLHPSRYLNEIYAQKIAERVEIVLESYLRRPNLKR